MTSAAPQRERTAVLLVAAVQLVNVVDFMMVTPLGNYFAGELHIPKSSVGTLVGSYAAAAAVAGLAGAFLLDRFDRRKALALSLVGLAAGTVLGGLAQGYGSLVAARLVAGACGGPATSIALAIVSDVVPATRRGAAMGTVMTAFGVSSIAGVPLALVLAEHGGFRVPFFVVGAMGAVAVVLVLAKLPSMPGHPDAVPTVGAQLAGLRRLVARPTVAASLAMTATLNLSVFVIIPHVATYVPSNLGYPQAQLPLLYLGGGLTSFLSIRALGRLVDRRGAPRVGTSGTLLVASATWLGFVWLTQGHLDASAAAAGRVAPWLETWGRVVPMVLFFAVYMVASSMRNVAYSALTSRVPPPEERARFQSVQSAVQHLASSAGGFLAAPLLVEHDGRILGMGRVAWISIALLLPFPLWMRAVSRRIEAERALAEAPELAAAPGGQAGR